MLCCSSRSVLIDIILLQTSPEYKALIRSTHPLKSHKIIFLMPKIHATTRIVTVIGSPIHHSLSPLIHNAAFEAQGLDMAYIACNVSPEQLAAAVSGWKAFGFAGSNVTLPHKQALLPFMDAISDEARAVGAMNTVVCQPQTDGSVTLYGDNTDVVGFITPLLPFQTALRDTEVAIFGAGGATRAVVYALLKYIAPKHIHLIVRNIEKGVSFVDEMQTFAPHADVLHAVQWENASEMVQRSTLLINGTPRGMYPNITETVWHADDFGAHHIGYDLIYNPLETQFLKDIASKSGRTLSGLEMFIGQAAASYRQWTGLEMPLDVVRRVLEDWRIR